MEFLAIYFEVKNEISKAIINHLLDSNEVSSIEELEGVLIGYFEKSNWKRNAEKIKLICKRRNIHFKIEPIIQRNWNAEWEANFEPVYIGDKCLVKAPFHKLPTKEDRIEIILEPKMAFGTAHHETTYLMMETMLDLDLFGFRVLDFGCGTGILSILAEKVGAGPILAIDNDKNAIENSIENIEINKCSKIEVSTISPTELADGTFDIILANINRNVLLDFSDTLYNKLSKQGRLMLSGILKSDRVRIFSNYERQGYILEDIKEKGEWMMMLWSKKS